MHRFIVPAIGFVVVVTLAITLIGVIVLRSPDTHSNLWPTVRSGYVRTPLGIVGSSNMEFSMIIPGKTSQQTTMNAMTSVYAQELSGPSPQSTDPGRAVYLIQGCTTCHGIDALGGPVGRSLAGSDSDIVNAMVRQGKGGMPAFSQSALSDADLTALATYLNGIPLTKPDPDDVLAIMNFTYDPSVPLSTLLRGKAAMRESCGACHASPTAEKLRDEYTTDYMAMHRMAKMIQNANVSLDDGKAIANYTLAVINGADPVQQP